MSDNVTKSTNKTMLSLLSSLNMLTVPSAQRVSESKPPPNIVLIPDPIHQAPSVEHAVDGDSFLASPILLTLLPQVREDHADSSWSPT